METQIHPPSSPGRDPQVTSNNPLKRKAPTDEQQQGASLKTVDGTTVDGIPRGEYEAGRVLCQTCSSSITFRDSETGKFTLKHWDAHRIACGTPAPASNEPFVYTPETATESPSHAPTKRRRAKRTEEERIEYLRADPYVAQFEAYRVLCSSCQKWIRLRPNSTYCSIPWDAHRKSCLSKRVGKNVYALDERTSLFEKDRDVRKFDPERVLCGICVRWISVSSTDHLQAVQKWLQHRAGCQKNVSAGSGPQGEGSSHTLSSLEDVPAPTEQQISLVSTSVPPPAPHPSTPTVAPRASSLSISSHHHSQSQSHSPRSPSTFQQDLNPTNFLPAHESRRRNAEQRAATLRADPLIGEVDPNKVFCSLCQKWVQLRQDSSYCAYPWLQHRGKCLARHQRRVQRAAEIAELKAARKHPVRTDVEAVYEDNVLDSDEDPESEEGADLGHGEESSCQRATLGHERKKGTIHMWEAGPSHPRRRDEDEYGQDVDADGDSEIEDRERVSRYSPSRIAYAPVRWTWPVGLADLDSPSGRKNFVFSAVDHLFKTTYESSDDMTISALLGYLNAAMPPDKHEDFDTGEVVKAVAALQAKGRINFEGDVVRLVD